MTIVLLANGFEEIEALTPVDMLRRAGLTVKTVGVSGRVVTGAHGICVISDLLPEDIDLSKVDTVIFPGGMPGTSNLDDSPFTDRVIRAVLDNGGRIGAICAAPLILGRRGLLKGKKAVCYPGFENELAGATIVDTSVITDGNITTARGMGVATEFSEEMIAHALGSAKAKEISRLICKDAKGDFKQMPLDDGDDPDSDCGIPNDECIKEDNTDFSDYTLPSSELLNEDIPFQPDKAAIEETANNLMSIFAFNKINANIIGVDPGVQVTRFIITVDSKTPVKKVVNLEDEIAITLGVNRVRIVVPIPGQCAIGIEIPNKKSGVVMLRGLLDTTEFKDSNVTSACLGREINGKPVICDVARMPHMIVSGATGMGKSVAISSILVSLLMKANPNQLKLIMIDPKQVEYTAYEGLPHLLCPIIHDPKTAAATLGWVKEEMERRYTLFTNTRTRNIDSYNKLESEEYKKLPYILVVIDELADLMLQAKNPIESQILIIAQKARAAGIHMILGTQRPSVDVITGLIKANVPTRLCCKVMSNVDSKVILDTSGAEKLLDRGDALYAPPGVPAPFRIQCAYVSDVEVERITDAIKSAVKDVKYDPDLTEYQKNYIISFGNPMIFDPDFLDAVEIALNTRKVSTSLIQRHLMIGYGKAAKFLDLMEELGIVSEMNGQRPRDVLMTHEEWQNKLSKFKKS